MFSQPVFAVILASLAHFTSGSPTATADNLGPYGLYTSPPPESLHLGWGKLATPLPSPSTTAAPGKINAAARTLTINIRNAATRSVYLSYASQVGGPAPVGNPTPAPLAAGATTAFLAPTGWSGTVFVGNNFNPNNSLIEANYQFANPDIDVSYNQGFSVPIVCGCGAGQLVTGCNKRLFSLHTCADERVGPVCVNPRYNTPNGPAAPFFEPCQGAAFTYPNDGGANAQCGDVSTLNCCIGPQCNPSTKQSP